jgi:excisionase family DNA binding protein
MKARCPLCKRFLLESINPDFIKVLKFAKKRNLTLPEVAKLLSTSKRTIYRWLQQSSLSGFKIKKIYLEKLKQLEQKK